MPELAEEDLHHVIRMMPKDLVESMRLRPRVFLAGGALRALIGGEKVADWDLFGSSEHELTNLMEALKLNRPGSRLHRTPNAITLLSPNYKPAQAITRWLYTTADALMESFDFTIARAVVWYDPNEDQWKSLVDERFYPDLAAKRLHYRAPVRQEDAGGSLLRVVKFLRRGYNIAPASLSKVVARVVDSIPSPPVGDTDVNILSRLREVDPLLLLDGLDVVDDLGD